MAMPGFHAEASLYARTASYQSTGGAPHRYDGQGARPQAIFGGGWGIGWICRGCYVCEPRTGHCICYYPCPIVTFPVPLV
jgi:hypothetical protein